ncbi:MAG: tRNA uridine-5-carboxymethylaminomethyl(34) synthesis enzyme MnmG [Phycisphaerales bacterium]|nr:tRNA uridine-5-carboxymethylaminomethyl(34) synthesis enzyme MnmG [Phycisphaerales bacterium]
MNERRFQVIVIGGGHAGVEAAWAAANILRTEKSVALVTIDPTKTGVMSCNPAIGGLAKGQLVREIDALGGLMGLAADATGIQFKVLNTSKGQAVRGPRAQCDKHAYAECVQAMLASRSEIQIVQGTVDELIVSGDRIRGVLVAGTRLESESVVLTTGTFMRALMHTGESKVEGGRFGEASAVGISGALRSLGFELGRLKTGTPPRLKRGSIRWDDLEIAGGDQHATPFSDLTLCKEGASASIPSTARFPVLEQINCRQTRTTAESHELIRANLHRAPMYSGQIESIGPRYCPSIEDKVVRFAERETHGVFLEPESLRDDWIYCNGISTSLPADVQDKIVRSMPGCENAEIYRYGYAVEYDMVRPHQIAATGMTRLVDGLFLAGQINGTSGYEEAGAQGLVAGLNAALRALDREQFTFGRDQAYIGVLMDDLVTKTPVEPYRMFTSRAEHRLMLRADNSADRLTPVARELGLLQNDLGELRWRRHSERAERLRAVNTRLDRTSINGEQLSKLVRMPEFDAQQLKQAMADDAVSAGVPEEVWETVFAERRYAPYIDRARTDIKRGQEMERRRLPDEIDYHAMTPLRTEARLALSKFRPETFGQASRLEGITPADVTLLAVLVQRHRRPPSASVGGVAE